MKLHIRTFDMGWGLGIVYETERRRGVLLKMRLPIPLKRATIRYSLRNQGLLRSLMTGFQA